MNIVVIGPGALGCLFSTRLAANGENVTLIDHNADRAAALANHLTLSMANQDLGTDLPITADTACLGQAELVLLTVKSPQVGDLLAFVLSHTPRQCLIVGLQNGIAHLPLFQDSNAGLALGVTAQGATLLKPGHVRHGGDGPTALGFLHPAPGWPSRLIHKAAATLSAAGLCTEIAVDIKERLWQKLLVNVGINGLTVLYDCPNGQLLEIAEAKARLIALVEEGIMVARARGIDVGSDPVGRCLEVCRATASNISSMLQDVRNGRSTEIMAINGALVAEAKKLAIPTPENELLVQQVFEKIKKVNKEES